MKNSVTEKKNTLEGISSRLEDAEECQWSGGQGSRKQSSWTTKKKKSNKKRDFVKECSNIFKYNNIHIIGIPRRRRERERKEKGGQKAYLKRW